MSKYKVGDMVRKLDTDCCSAKEDKIYEVRSFGSAGSIGIGDDESHLCSCENQWELIDSPKSKAGALSTNFAKDYVIKNEPKGVKLEVGKSYTLADGYGNTYNATIMSMRKIGEDVIVYYKHLKQDGKLWPTYINKNVALQTFRAQLLDYGKITSLDLLYPESPTE